ncbi:retropepsin-like aspartic protease family protein [Anianabacter salinae]|uniref:retropepsin-like aspartic protease family protein n=1 Tax=Anianabacter salinae TaxID=2851023 RepID=UPI00225DE8F3|nr:TIGR02281 family clan AA aspartic protease [Anianabacter salinae]MBV0911663.1 TIGR02281 family clan AA aspartic protease [Anianabacter salinae]
MDADNTARFLYLALLGGAIAAYFFAANRNRLGQVAQQALVWGLLFIGVIAAYGLWTDIRPDVLPQQAVVSGDGARIEVPQGFDGHYRLTLGLNGAPVDFIVDTGATDMVLTPQDAARAGVDEGLAFTGRAGTANGEVRTARVRLDTVTLGPITDRNVSATVNAADMPASLLGMGYLRRFERIEISGGRLILER